jgi:hypothetical protein
MFKRSFLRALAAELPTNRDRTFTARFERPWITDFHRLTRARPFRATTQRHLDLRQIRNTAPRSGLTARSRCKSGALGNRTVEASP